MVSWDADGDGVAQAGRALGGGDAHAELALAAPQLGGLAGDVAQPGEHGAGRGEQPVLAGGGGELGEPGAEHEASLHVARHQTVVLERDREAVSRGSGQPGSGDETGQCRGACLECGENKGWLILPICYLAVYYNVRDSSASRSTRSWIRVQRTSGPGWAS